MRKPINVILFFLRWVGSPEVVDALKDERFAEFIAELIAERMGDLGDGTLIRDLIKFLWDNKEEILDFVLSIIGLFSLDGQLVLGACGDAAGYPHDALMNVIDLAYDDDTVKVFGK